MRLAGDFLAGEKADPMRGTVRMNSPPAPKPAMALRKAAICTMRLPSSTAALPQAAAINVSLVTASPFATDELCAPEYRDRPQA
jgi:hypothetical protein